jgi:hypothetical protein
MLNGSRRKLKLGGINASILALIPKESIPLSFSRFRRISLCNASYKILTKTLANRLSHVLPNLISKEQGGFVKRRQITNNIILVKEAIHSNITNKEKGMVIKVDMANAFDRARHCFLLAVLIKFGFDAKFIKWIKACISKPWITPLVNGWPTPFFLGI